jgi:hypothetical protein
MSSLAGEPEQILGPHGRAVVKQRLNHWRAQADWWRARIERDHWRLLLDDDSVCEVVHDLTDDTWSLDRIYD